MFAGIIEVEDKEEKGFFYTQSSTGRKPKMTMFLYLYFFFKKQKQSKKQTKKKTKQTKKISDLNFVDNVDKGVIRF